MLKLKEDLPHDHGNGEQLKNLQTQLDNEDKLNNVADLFQHLGSTTRLRIFWLLCHCEECVINIAAMMNMSRKLA